VKLRVRESSQGVPVIFEGEQRARISRTSYVVESWEWDEGFSTHGWEIVSTHSTKQAAEAAMRELERAESK
jgi:hypothetical protein